MLKFLRASAAVLMAAAPLVFNPPAAILVAGISLASCSQSVTPTSVTTTLDDIVAKVKAQCSYIVDYEAIAQVVATLVTGFSPTAGAATTVAINVADAVIADVCKSVVAAANSSKLGAAPATGSGTPLNVVVNGVTIHGTYSGKK
jgi:hypothetical protein